MRVGRSLAVRLHKVFKGQSWCPFRHRLSILRPPLYKGRLRIEGPTPLEVGITINCDTMPDFEPRLGLGPSQGLLLESKRVSLRPHRISTFHSNLKIRMVGVYMKSLKKAHLDSIRGCKIQSRGKEISSRDHDRRPKWSAKKALPPNMR